MAIVKKDINDTKIRCLIKSTNLLETIYDTSNKKLLITFNSGRHYEYQNVDPKVYSGLEVSESQGQYFHKYIKGLPSVRLADVDPYGLLVELNPKQ